MRPSRHRPVRAIVPAALALVLAAGTAGTVSGDPTRTLVPIGSSYEPDTLQLFAGEAAAADTSGRVVIAVLPITYGLDAYVSKNGERNRNLTLADNRRGQIEDACNAVRRPDQTCSAILVPTLVRADAEDPTNAALIDADVDGMYVLGGDQTVAMQVVANTPLEDAMAAAFARGAVLGGNSAGDAVQSRDMINGYTGSNGPAESLRQGAVDVWAYDGPTDDTRGLRFGLPNAITDQHVFEYGRTGRSINVAVTRGAPVVGMDAATGAVITDFRTLHDVTGYTVGYVVDPVTYGATPAWGGPNATLRTRGVAFHLLAPGGAGYDFETRRPTDGTTSYPAPDLGARAYPSLATSAGAGALFLSGGLVGQPAGPVHTRFVAASGGTAARILVLSTGYAKNAAAQADAKALATSLQAGVTAPVTWQVLDAKARPADLVAAVNAATGIVITSPDRSRVLAGLATFPTVRSAIEARWRSGQAAVLADDAAAAALGARFVADGVPTDVEAAAPEDLLPGGVTVIDGLGWAPTVSVEPRLLPDQNWAQLFRLAAADGTRLTAGIDVGTAVELSGGAARVAGTSAAVVVDDAHATFTSGTNGALGARWLVLDSWVDGETLAP